MFPLFDENPTARRPIVTWFLIVVSIAAYAVPAMTADRSEHNLEFEASGSAYELPDDLRFTLERAAVPCEIIQRRPLSTDEIRNTYFDTGDPLSCETEQLGVALFPAKKVLLAIVTSLFLHGGWFHLGLNMLFLWVFGNNVEDRLGHLGFAMFYLVSGIVATVAYVVSQTDGTVAILGASGAVAGVMGSYSIWFPDAPIRTLVFLILVDIRARWFLGGWFAIQFFTWTGPGAWIAHVSGFAFGVIAGRIVRKFQPRLRLLAGQALTRWDETGGAGHGPYPHLDEVWTEPHHEYYEALESSADGAVERAPTGPTEADKTDQQGTEPAGPTDRSDQRPVGERSPDEERHQR